MPRRKKDTLIPLPNEISEPKTKVEIALKKVKDKKKTVIVEDALADGSQEENDDDIEYVITPVAPVVPVAPAPVEPKPKRKYTKTKTKPKPIEPIDNSVHGNNDIFKQLDLLRKENELLKNQNNLNNISRLSNIARSMKILF